MKRLYKLFSITTCLLLFLAFTSTSFGQVPAGGATDVSITTTYDVPSGSPGSLVDATSYDLAVLNSAGDAVIGAVTNFTYSDAAGNSGLAGPALVNYTDYQWIVVVTTEDPLSPASGIQYGPFTFTTIGPTITLTGGGGSIAENGGTAVLTATASAPIGKNLDVTVTYTGTVDNSVYGTDFTNSGGANPETITITAGTLTKTTTLTGVADTFLEGDETIIGTITAVASGIIGGSAQTVTITDAESLVLSGGATIAEDGGTATLTATVSGGGTLKLNAGGSLSITLTYTGTAVGGTDYTNTGATYPAETLTLTDGSSSISTTVTGLADTFLEGDETAIATMTTGVTGLAIGGSPQTVTITDAESLILSGGATITEAATGTLTATVSGGGTLKLNGGGNLSITLTYTGTAVDGGTDYTNTSGETLTLNNGDPSASKTITPVNDAIIELDETIIAAMSTGVTGLTVSGTPQTITLTDDTETVLTSPADAAVGQDLDVALTWDAVVGADQYKLYVNTALNFLGTAIINGVDQGNVLTDTPGGLDDNTTYYWKVVPRNIATSDTRAASDTEVRSFTTVRQGDGTFPLDDAVGVVLFPTLTWPATTGADTYRLEVNTATNFAGTVIYDNSALTTTSKQIAGLSNATEYFWRVTAHSNLAKVNTSTVNSFTTSTDKYVTPTYPINSDVVFTLVPNLTWSVSNSVSGLTYDYQISSTNSFDDASPTPVTGISATNATTATLSGGTTYYWRARSKTSGGLYSQWSAVATFATQTGLLAAPTPTLSWPVGDPKLFDSTPTLYWFLSSVPPQGATLTYDIEVELVGTAFDGTPTHTGVGSSTVTNFTIPSALTAGASYHWQVRTKNVTASITGSWSSEGTFNINIGEGASPTPILSWPISGTTVYSITPTLYWYLGVATTGTITYDVDVYTDVGLTTLIGSVAGISAQSWTFEPTVAATPLSGGSTYYWKVTVHNSLGGADASSSLNGSFVVASSINSAPDPVLLYPIGGATVYSTKPALYWYLEGPPPSGATITYDIKVDNTANFSSPEDTKLANTSQSYTVVTALTPGTYYWQVKTNNTTAGTNSGYLPATGTAANSFVVAATASGASVAPTPLFPTGNAVVGSLTPTLSWIANGVVPSGATYDLELKPTTLAFDGAGLVTGISTTSTTTVTLQPGTAYRWRVRITHSSLVPDPSAWSVEALFTTSATAAPPPPMVGDPINGVMVPSIEPEISWFLPSAPRTALKYRLQIADDMLMNNIVVELDDIDAFSTVVNTLDGGKTYYWRVQSKDVNGVYSAHSNSGRFSTPSITSVEEEAIIPTEFEVSQNYPNPFNPTTTIRFALPEASFVTLRIYNMLGQEVKTLVNEQKNAGTFNVKWNGENNFGTKVASGTYIYRVIAGANIFTKKMILLK